MAIQIYHAIRELTFDQARRCDWCSRTYTMPWREFARASDTVLFSEQAARRRAEEGVSRQTAKKAAAGVQMAELAWQRCPYCGKYSERDLATIGRAFAGYNRVHRSARIIFHVLGGSGLFFGFLILLALALDPPAPELELRMPLLIAGCTAVAIGILLIGAGAWTGTQRAFRRATNGLNEAARIERFLAHWNRKGARAMSRVLAPRDAPDAVSYQVLNRCRYLCDGGLSPDDLEPRDFAETHRASRASA